MRTSEKSEVGAGWAARSATRVRDAAKSAAGSVAGAGKQLAGQAGHATERLKDGFHQLPEQRQTLVRRATASAAAASVLAVPVIVGVQSSGSPSESAPSSSGGNHLVLDAPGGSSSVSVLPDGRRLILPSNPATPPPVGQPPSPTDLDSAAQAAAAQRKADHQRIAKKMPGVYQAVMQRPGTAAELKSLVHFAQQRYDAGASVDEALKQARSRLAKSPAAQLQNKRWSGSAPAPGTTSMARAKPLDAPTRSVPGIRSADLYNRVINQFAVGENRRYERNTNTYCNIFLWDVTRAMGAEIPHWVDQQGRPAKPYARGAWEMSANDTHRWLSGDQGRAHGWKKVSASKAQALANAGQPVVVSWPNPGGIGHVAVIRPGKLSSQGPQMAQAGARNFNHGQVADGFGNLPVTYLAHA